MNKDTKVWGTSISFDMGVAYHCGVNAAIVFQNIIFWLRVNKKNPDCLKDGKIWMYQKQSDIAELTGCLTTKEVRHAIEVLIQKEYLIKGKFSNNPFNQTNWYTVPDQSLIFESIENSKSKFETPKKANAEDPPVSSESPPGLLYNKEEDIEDKDIEKKYTYRSQTGPAPTADAEELYEFFLQTLKEKVPNMKLPNKSVWLSDIDKLLRIDKRDIGEAKALIKHIRNSSSHKYILSPASLRKNYDKQLEFFKEEQREERIRKNREVFLKAKNKFPEHLKTFTFSKNYVTDVRQGIDIPLDLPQERFEERVKHVVSKGGYG